MDNELGGYGEGKGLLPCPFCGGPVKLEKALPSYSKIYGERKWYGVVCRNTRNNFGSTCSIQQTPSASIEAAVNRWNTRNGVLQEVENG